MRPGDKCHYLDTREDHSVDLRPCVNCAIPVCVDCRIDGFCLECSELRGNDFALLMRASEMENFYKRCYKYGV